MSESEIRIGGAPCEFVQIGIVVKDLDRTVNGGDQEAREKMHNAATIAGLGWSNH